MQEVKVTFATDINDKEGTVTVNEKTFVDDRLHAFFKHVINIQDEEIRKGLIALGWTPPKE